MFTTHDVFEKDPKMMREVYCDTLIELALVNDDIIALDADLMSSSGMKPFFQRFPERAFNCGVAEANMIGISAGLSAMGKIPFAHSFGCFASRRVCDQVMISAAYAKQNVRIVGSDPGVTAAYNGGTHMPFEDMGVLRSIPEITLIEPADNVVLADVVRQLEKEYGVFYIRMARKNAVSIYQEGSNFHIGRGNTLLDGTDVTIFASGIMVHEALKAASILQVDGVSARIVDMFTWKPIDTELVENCARITGAFVTAENHNIVGGLGSAIAEVAAQTRPVPIEMVGVKDRFGQVGTEDFLRTEYELTAADIVAAAKRATQRKG
ncbi:MAG: transketolase family protein [Oscillospiraceae bacterium]|nr:transketolase family protein [Oscillospiraceae bacterium]MCL2278425.1 transketolase family protein [Oscillospiraceae bacterium]